MSDKNSIIKLLKERKLLKTIRINKTKVVVIDQDGYYLWIKEYNNSKLVRYNNIRLSELSIVTLEENIKKLEEMRECE